MKYGKVLLINPAVLKSYMGPIRPPSGLGYLEQYLENNGINIDIIDMSLGYSLRHLWKKIEKFRPDLICVTIWTYRYKDTYEFIGRIKERYPNVDIAVGGPHVSTLRKNVLEDCKDIDYGVVLEGEETLFELCRGRKLEEIKGLLYWEKGEVRYEGDRDFLNNLDSVPFPKYKKFEIDKYILKEMLIISSRGCPFDCIYCPVKLAIGQKLRIRSAGNIVDELEYWYNKKYRKFNFGDDNFSFFKDRVYDICDEIEKRNLKGLDLRCGNGVRADRVDKPLLKRMREIGFSYLGFGVEAGNNRILKNIKKGERIEKIEEAIKNACELGYDVTLFFLAGSPGETLSDIADSVKLAQKYPIFDARFYNIIPYPGTELFEWIKKRRLFVRQPQDYLNDAVAFSRKPLFKTPELSVKERVNVLRQLKRVENKILRKNLKRKLKQYGFLGRMAANFVPIEFMHYLIRQNKFIRRISEKIRYDLNQRPLDNIEC
ncbi:MAG: radical SAM protein [Candidatus Omnitrophica bacterium]|nr:radical SAM protein [Candidatus Omnitrophota bacterium]MDD5429322.1 radical SAM protein [Candidatus Omnitrophota bacterium]